MTLRDIVRRKVAGLRRRVPAAVDDTSLQAVLPDLETKRDLPRFQVRPDPRISILIPAFGELQLTLRCLHSIAAAGSSIAFEVIVIDDGSEPPLADTLKRIPGLRVLRSKTRQGFVGASNSGAKAARASRLVFLNNDTAVTPGWLEALDAHLDRPDVGLVGAQLISPDGLVQEAGGIIWQDGSATNYGRGLHPDDPVVGYSRPVDYCSGACLMIDRSLFARLGGFDARYAPAYYEDVDLAFAVREAGYSVQYEPGARVFHVEGGTAGTDVEVGVKQFQVRNQEVFCAKWQSSLLSQPLREFGVVVARRHRFARSCLVVDRHLPTPGRDGGSQRLMQLLDELLDMSFHATLAAYDLEDDPSARRHFESRGIEVLRKPFVQSIKEHLARHGEIYDYVVLSRLGVASRLLPLVRRHCPRARVLFDSVDLRSVREARAAQLHADRRALRAARKTEERELEVVAQVDATLVTSPTERKYLSQRLPSSTITLVPTSYPTVTPASPFEARSGALFVGGFRHGPNLDAMLWFLEEIWPQIHLILPGFQLHVVGEDPPHELIREATEGVKIHGFVEDLSPLFERCRMSIAPLRYGAGLKSKVHQSLAWGLPCVATPIAAEGLGLMPDIHAVLADGVSRFAEGVTRLNSDRELWQRISIEGRAHVENYFSAKAFRAGLKTALATGESE